MKLWLSAIVLSVILGVCSVRYDSTVFSYFIFTNHNHQASTYIGGTGNDAGNGIAIGSDGSVYTVGNVSANYPATTGAYKQTTSGNTEVVVSKFSSGLGGLLASTFIGSTGADLGNAIVLDASGYVYIAAGGAPTYPRTTGTYTSSTFGTRNVAISKLTGDLSVLEASTKIGGGTTSVNEGFAIALDSVGNIYVAGYGGTSYPTTGTAYDTTLSGTRDVIISKLSNDMTSFLASTFAGGSSSTEQANDMLITSSDTVYIVGYAGAGYPTSGTAYDNTMSGGRDVIITAFDSGLSNLLAGTYVGGANLDEGMAIQYKNNEIVVAGVATDGFPTTAGAYDTTFNAGTSPFDAFVSKFDSGLTTLIASTFIGGVLGDWVQDVYIHNSNQIIIGGYTQSSGFPTTPYALDSGFDGTENGFMGVLDWNLSGLQESTLIGSGNTTTLRMQIRRIAGNGERIYTVGTSPNNYPTTTGAYQTGFSGGNGDIVVSYFLGDSIADLYITKSGSGVLSYGSSVVFRLNYGNSGSMDNVSGISIYDYLPSGFSGMSSNPSWSIISGNIYIWSGINLTTGSTGIIYFTAQVISTVKNQYVFNTGEIVWIGYDINTGNNVSASQSLLNFSGVVYTSCNVTFIGGTHYDFIERVVTDTTGNVYVLGYTFSTNYPSTTGVYQTGSNGDYDVVVSKFSSDLTQLLASTYIGGKNTDKAYDMILDTNQDIVIVGEAGSGYPATAGSYDSSHNGGQDIFVTRLNNVLTGIINSTFYGLNIDETATAIVQKNNYIYVVGTIVSVTGFPSGLYTGYDETANGGTDIIAIKFNNNLTGLITFTLFGDTSNEVGKDLAIIEDKIYVLGERGTTFSSPTWTGYDTTQNGGTDFVIGKFNENLTGLDNATFIGSLNDDTPNSIDVDNYNNIFVAGQTNISAFLYPTTVGAYSTAGSGTVDVVVSKFDKNLTSLLASTFLGGSGTDVTYDMNVDDNNNIVVAGVTQNIPIVGGFDTTLSGSEDAFIAVMNNGLTNLLESTYLGGGTTERIESSFMVTNGLYSAGYTDSPDFPVTPGAYDTVYDGLLSRHDGFIAYMGACFTTNQYSDVYITKTSSQTGVYYNQYITYTLNFGNSGAAASDNVTIKDLMVSGVQYISSSWTTGLGFTTGGISTGLQSGGLLVTRTIGSVGANLTGRIVLTGLVTSSFLASGSIGNTGTIQGSGTEASTGNDTGGVSVVYLPSAFLSISKTLTGVLQSGNSVRYTLSYYNSGPDLATGIVITDYLQTGLSGVSASPARGSFAAGVYTWTGLTGNVGSTGSIIFTAQVVTGTINVILVNTGILSRSGFNQSTGNLTGVATGLFNRPVDLYISKTSNQTGAGYGQTITYVLNFGNSGTVNENNTVVRDMLVTGLQYIESSWSTGGGVQTGGYSTSASASGVLFNWSIGRLEVGGTGRIVLTAQVVNSFINVGVIGNTGTILGSGIELNSGNNTGGVTIAYLTSAALSISKTVTGQTNIYSGLVTYVISYTNTGPDTATGVMIYDTLPGGFTGVSAVTGRSSFTGNTYYWTGINIAAGGTGSIVFTAQVLTSTLNYTAVNNVTIQWTGYEPSLVDNTASATIQVNKPVDLYVSKTSNQTGAGYGQTITYVLNFGNSGSIEENSGVIRDLLVTGLQYIESSWSTGGGVQTGGYSTSASASGVLFNWSIGRLEVGGTGRIVLTAQVVNSFINVGVIGNTGTILGSGIELNSGNNTGGVSIAYLTSASLSISKSVTGQVNIYSGLIRYVISYVNTGPDTATSVTIYDVLPTGFTGVSALTGRSSFTGNTYYWTGINIAAGGTGSIVFTAQVLTSTLNYTAVNNVTIQWTGYEPLLVDNTASATIQVNKPVDLYISKTSNQTGAGYGQTITYVLNFGNSGSIEENSGVIRDLLVTGLAYIDSSWSTGGVVQTGGYSTSASASGVLFNWNIGRIEVGGTGRVVLTAQVVNSFVSVGAIGNTGNIVGSGIELNSGNNTGGVSILYLTSVDLVMHKAVSGNFVSGGLITYTLSYYNLGPDSISGVRLTDTLGLGLSGISSAPSRGNVSGNVYTWTGLSSIAGNTGTIVFTAMITTGTLDFIVTNTGYVTSSGYETITGNNIYYLTALVNQTRNILLIELPAQRETNFSFTGVASFWQQDDFSQITGNNANHSGTIHFSNLGTGYLSITMPSNGSGYMMIVKSRGHLSVGYTGYFNASITGFDFSTGTQPQNFERFRIFSLPGISEYPGTRTLAIPGDLNQDDQVTALDLALENTQLTRNATIPERFYDFNIDGFVTAKDQAIIIENIGRRGFYRMFQNNSPGTYPW